LISEKQFFDPFSNYYFNSKNEKASFKVPGYKYSYNFQITTVGLSGTLGLALENKDHVPVDKLYQ